MTPNKLDKIIPHTMSLSTQPQPFFNLKILHLAKKDYTTSGCKGCDKYVVWTKMRIFIDNVSCTKCPKSIHFLRSQITVWLYKVWVAFLSRQKGLLKVNHRWSPDVQGESIPLFQDKLCQKASQSWSSLITRCPHLAHWLGRCLGKSPMGSQSLSHSWRK